MAAEQGEQDPEDAVAATLRPFGPAEWDPDAAATRELQRQARSCWPVWSDDEGDDDE